jgi:hypothetical protein
LFIPAGLMAAWRRLFAKAAKGAWEITSAAKAAEFGLGTVDTALPRRICNAHIEHIEL